VTDLERKDLLDLAAALRKSGMSPRTVRNRVDSIQVFLHHFALPSLLQGKDLPRYTEKKTLAFSREEISALLAHADRDEADWIQFFLATGVRDQEAAYACWSDVNFDVKTFTVREHLDLGFRPKGRGQGSIPIPESLVTLLRKRRYRAPRPSVCATLRPGPAQLRRSFSVLLTGNIVSHLDLTSSWQKHQALGVAPLLSQCVTTS
jgi:integrase/recombinase XerD